jgi:hypothetical protein
MRANANRLVAIGLVVALVDLLLMLLLVLFERPVPDLIFGLFQGGITLCLLATFLVLALRGSGSEDASEKGKAPAIDGKPLYRLRVPLMVCAIVIALLLSVIFIRPFLIH